MEQGLAQQAAIEASFRDREALRRKYMGPEEGYSKEGTTYYMGPGQGTRTEYDYITTKDAGPMHPNWNQRQGLAGSVGTMPSYGPAVRYDNYDGREWNDTEYMGSSAVRVPNKDKPIIVPEEVAAKYRKAPPVDVTDYYSLEQLKALADRRGEPFNSYHGGFQKY